MSRPFPSIAASLVVAGLLLGACRVEAKPKPAPARASLEAARSLCPYPKEKSPALSVCGIVTHERASCLETELSRGSEARLALPQADRWRALERAYGEWYLARCGVDEMLWWVDLETREWSSGTAEGLPEDWCLQRMREERLFFHAARASGMGPFWKLVEERQAAGARILTSLKRARAATTKDAAPSPDPLGSVRPAQWRELVQGLDVAIDRPAILAQQHCKALGGPKGCVRLLTLYLHSIAADAHELDFCS